MNKDRQSEICLNKLAHLKEQLLGNSLVIGHLNANAKHSRRKIYETVDFLWINIVLTSLKFIHIREKRNYLLFLHNSNNHKLLLTFYKLINVTDFAITIPSIGFFSDYVKYFESQQLENIMNNALKQINFIKSEFNLLSIDGKDIRNCNGRNIKSVNVVVNHSLRGSYIVDSEMTWIKNKLTSLIDELFKQDNSLIFIGDGIYHNTRIRKFFADKGYLAILPMMNLTRRFEGRLNSNIGIKINQKKHVKYSTTDKRSSCIINETVMIIPIKSTRYREFNKWTYVIDIETISTNFKTDKEHTKHRRFLTNIHLPCNGEAAIKLRGLVRQHWQVETFHQYKDVNLLEDKYSKARSKAGYKSMINNFARLLQEICGVNNKHDIERFKNSVLLAIAFLFMFLTEQH